MEVKMSMQKQQRMNMHFEKITLYSVYVSCLTRVIHDFIDNGNGNTGLKPTDIPNLMNLLLRYTDVLLSRILKLKGDWEFGS